MLGMVLNFEGGLRVWMTVGGPPAVIVGMKVHITRELVEKVTDEFGRESAVLEVEQDAVDVSVKIQSWNDRFFEVITSKLVLDADDVLDMFEDAEDDEDL